MNPKKTYTVQAILCLLILCGGLRAADASKSPAFSYPVELLKKIGITTQDVIKNQEKFKTDTVHLEWMQHVHSVISDIDPDQEYKIITSHTSMLYMKDRINSAYLGGGINQQEFTAQSAELMQWFLKIHQEMLSKKKYESLFGISRDEGSSADIPGDKGLGFPVNNPQTTIKMIKENFDDRTITNLVRFYRKQSQELMDFRKMYKAGEFRGATEDQVKKDMLRIERELQTAFMSYCRDILTKEQFKMIFGNSGDEK